MRRRTRLVNLLCLRHQARSVQRLRPENSAGDATTTQRVYKRVGIEENEWRKRGKTGAKGSDSAPKAQRLRGGSVREVADGRHSLRCTDTRTSIRIRAYGYMCCQCHFSVCRKVSRRQPSLPGCTDANESIRAKRRGGWVIGVDQSIDCLSRAPARSSPRRARHLV